jgi:hypothetical protein
VADIFPLDHEDHHFRNFGGMVGDLLKAFGDIVDLDAMTNAGELHRLVEQLTLAA